MSEKKSTFPDVERLLVDLARAYSWLGMYRADHPSLPGRMEPVHGALTARIAEEPSGRLLFGIAKDKVLYHDEFLGGGQHLVRRFTESLFLNHVATLDFAADLRPEDLLAFFRGLHRVSTEKSGEQLEALLKADGVRGVRVYPYNYKDVLSRRILAPDEVRGPADREDELWRMLLTENVSAEAGAANIAGGLADSPEMIPAILRRAYFTSAAGTKTVSAADPDAAPVSPELIRKLLERLGEVVSALPEERKEQFLQYLETGFEGLCGDREDTASLEQFFGESLTAGRSDDEFLELLAAFLSAEGKGGRRLRKVFDIVASERNRDDSLLKKAGDRIRESLRTRNYFAQKTWETVEGFLLARSEEAYLGKDHSHLLEALSSLGAGDAREAPGNAPISEPGRSADFSDEAVHRKSSAVLLELLTADSPEEEFLGILEDFRKIIPNLVSRKEFPLLGSVLLTLAVIEKESPEERKPAISDVIGTTDFAHMIDLYLSPDLESGEKGHVRDIIVAFADVAIHDFLDRLLMENDKTSRRSLLDAAFQFGPAAVPAILERMSDPHWYFVRNLSLVLGEMGDPRAVPELVRMLDHPRHRVRREAIVALGKIKAPESIPFLGKILLTDTLIPSAADDSLRIDAANAVSRCGVRGVSYLHRALNCRRAAVKEYCSSLLRRLSTR